MPRALPTLWQRVLASIFVGAAGFAALLVTAYPTRAAYSEFPELGQGPASTAKNSSSPTPPLATNVPIPTAIVPAISSVKTNAPVAVVTNVQADPATNGMEMLDNRYKLAVGDHISYRVKEDEDDPKSIVVSDSGDVEIPYIGPYPATGKTCKQLAEQLKAILEKKYYYQATVIISVDSMVSQGVIYLVGAVKSPGPLEIPRDEVLTVSKAILRAGGFTDFANGKEVRVTRKDESSTNEVFVVNVSDVLDKGKTEKDQPVESGDLIYVPEKAINF
ncbi:MAG TPA: polysaccharide biosynthesis/export family protein [Verrucomicrobiae bacterium]|jgi:protein involved in polysaccharide export with SLBB domain